MLSPGLLIVAGRVKVSVGAAKVPDYFNGGIGYTTGDKVSIDSNAVSGAKTTAGGFAVNSSGAIYGKTSGTVANYIGGIPVDASGNIIYTNSAPDSYQNGNPMKSGTLAVNTA